MRAVGATFDRFFGERGTHLAAMVAYFALASFVPLIFLALSILGFLDQADSSSALVAYLEDVFPNQSVESIVNVVEAVQRNATTYFRSTFAVADPAAFGSLALEMKYDDGAIVYLNGAIAAITDNMTPGMAFDEFSDGDTPNENTYFQFPVPASLLVPGTNTLAVEVHQGDDGSSDVSFDLALTAVGVSSDPGDFVLRAAVAGRSASS